jgi:hypothetical protein
MTSCPPSILAGPFRKVSNMQRRGFLALMGGFVAVAVTQGSIKVEAAARPEETFTSPVAIDEGTAAKLDEAPAEFSQYRYRRVYYRRPVRVYRRPRRVYYRRPVRVYRRPVRRVYYRRPVRVYRAPRRIYRVF